MAMNYNSWRRVGEGVHLC